MDRTSPTGRARSRRLPPPIRTPPPLRTKRVPGWQKDYEMEDLGCVTSARSRGVAADEEEAADGDQGGEVEEPPELALSEDEDAGHGSAPGSVAGQPAAQTVPGPLPCPASSSSDSTRSGGSSTSPTSSPSAASSSAGTPLDLALVTQPRSSI